MDANEQRALPKLPPPEIVDPGRYGIAYTAEQMREYAIAALAQQVPADGEVKAWLIRADNGMAIKCVMSEQERDALLFRGESSQFPEWTATPLVEAATPQAPQPVVGCDTCGPSGVMAANGTGPYDCYVCGKSASQPQQGAVAEVKWAGPIPQKVLDWPRGLVPFINGAAIGTKLYAHPPTIGQQAATVVDHSHSYVQSKEHGGCSECGYPKWEPWHLTAALAAHGNGDPDAAR